MIIDQSDIEPTIVGIEVGEDVEVVEIVDPITFWWETGIRLMLPLS